MPFAVTGHTAELRHAWLVAATCGPWRIEGGRFTAPVLSSNDVQLARSPLDLVLQHGLQRFRVRDVRPQISGGRVSLDVPAGRIEEW